MLELMLDSIHGVTHSYGLSIMALSVVISLLLTPVTAYARRLEAKGSARQQAMAPFIAEAKAASAGRAQFEKIDAIYQRYGYHPIHSMISLLPLLIQLPFLLAAVFLLVDHSGLAGKGFLFIQDLSEPDALLSFASLRINLLPIALTAIAIAESHIRPEATVEARRHFLFVAAILLILIYPFPAGVCLYWLTANSVSLAKSCLRRRGARDRTQNAG